MANSIQSIRRCLNILQELNLRNGLTIADLCSATRLTRGTVYRILETLRAEGFLRKDIGSSHYWLAERVRTLSDGYQDEWWIDAFAREIMENLGRFTQWPVKLLTLQGHEMMTRVTTDFSSHFTDGKYPTGLRIALLWSAAGRVFLAFSEESIRRTLIDAAVDMAADQDGSVATIDRSQVDFQTDGYAVVKTSRPRKHTGRPAELAESLAQIRREGYAIVHTTGAIFYTLAVPVMSEDRVVGAISLHVFRSVVRPAKAIASFLGPLREASGEIGRRLAMRAGSG